MLHAQLRSSTVVHRNMLNLFFIGCVLCTAYLTLRSGSRTRSVKHASCSVLSKNTLLRTSFILNNITGNAPGIMAFT